MAIIKQYHKDTNDHKPCVVVSTASPFKFAPAILPAMDLDFEGTDFQMLEAMENGTPIEYGKGFTFHPEWMRFGPTENRILGILIFFVFYGKRRKIFLIFQEKREAQIFI